MKGETHMLLAAFVALAVGHWYFSLPVHPYYLVKVTPYPPIAMLLAALSTGRFPIDDYERGGKREKLHNIWIPLAFYYLHTRLGDVIFSLTVLGFSIGWATHIFLDALTNHGVVIAYPLPWVLSLNLGTNEELSPIFYWIAYIGIFAVAIMIILTV